MPQCPQFWPVKVLSQGELSRDPFWLWDIGNYVANLPRKSDGGVQINGKKSFSVMKNFPCPSWRPNKMLETENGQEVCGQVRHSDCPKARRGYDMGSNEWGGHIVPKRCPPKVNSSAYQAILQTHKRFIQPRSVENNFNYITNNFSTQSLKLRVSAGRGLSAPE